MPGLARGTAAWFAAPLAAGLGLALVALLGPPAAAGWAWAAAAVLLAAAAFLGWFFRDPERAPAPGTAEDALVSPADGKVVEVREGEDGGRVVVVFMNLHDCHVNRAPCQGTVLRRVHHPGSLVPAWHKDSERNERVVWDLATAHGEVRVVQIAGLLARRIVPYLGEGARVRRGERLGIIRLGSRVDVHLPPGVEPAVRPGQRLRAGTTALAHPPPGPRR